MLLAITAAGHADVPRWRFAGAVEGKNKIIGIPSAEAAKGEDSLAHLFLLPPQKCLTIHGRQT